MFKNMPITLAKNISHVKKIKAKTETLKNMDKIYIFFSIIFFGQKNSEKYDFIEGNLTIFNVF